MPSLDGSILEAKVLARQVRRKILTGQFATLLLELCCGEDSMLAAHAPDGCLSVRITQRDDMTRTATRRMIHGIIRFACRCGLQVHGWISIPCTAGCRIKYLNDFLEQPTGDPELTEALIAAVVPICKHLIKRQQHFSWEWPETNLLWDHASVQKLLSTTPNVQTCLVATAAVGLNFEKIVDGQPHTCYLKKRWRIDTTHPALPTALAPYSTIPAFPVESFVPTLGKFAR